MHLQGPWAEAFEAEPELPWVISYTFFSAPPPFGLLAVFLVILLF